MFVNTNCITLFHEGVDPIARMPTSSSYVIHNVYWENCSTQENGKNGRGITSVNEDDLIFCVIPINSITDYTPCKGDIIVRKEVQSLSDIATTEKFTITSVKDFNFGAGRVRHIEVTAK